MKHWGKKAVSLLLAAVMSLTAVPGLEALAAEGDGTIYTLENGYLTATVSGKNGGFQVRTSQGDKLVKDDDNQNLLFPDGEYDTSFTSIRVTRGGMSKDYIFGRRYPAEGSTTVETTQAEGAIRSVWSVDGLTFTQTITLAGAGSNEHGMAHISYDVRKQTAFAQSAEVSLRVLLDTALGYQDCAVYELSGANVTGRVEQEKVIARGEEGFYQQSFFAYDDYRNPTMTAFTVNAPIGGTECVPSKVAFGHWNNLASTVFDFTPNEALTFTNPYNVQYLTADSAYALYFDSREEITGTADQTVCATYYGVYSNEGVEDTAKVSVNVTLDTMALELTEDKTSYIDDGKFNVKTVITNFVGDNAKDYDKVLVAVYPATGITVYEGDNAVENVSYAKPYTIMYSNFNVAEQQENIWTFSAAVGADSHYRKIEFKVFDISGTDGSAPDLLVENLLGSGSVMILCPGGDGKLPEIQFTSGSPEIVYHQGTRNLFYTATNLSMLNMTAYDLCAVSADGREYPIPDGDVKIDEGKGTVQVILSPEQALPVGGYRLEFRHTDQSTLTAPALAFTVSDDPKYKNEGYAIVAVVQDSQPSDEITYSIQAFPNEPDYETYVTEQQKEVLFELRGGFELKKIGNTITQAVAVSRSQSDPVVINNCFDLVDGSLTVYQANNEIKVDIDGELLTSGVRSPVWDGVAGFTTIKNGEDYQLRPYSASGKPKTGPEGMGDKKPITLLWPSAGGLGQTLAGFIFNFQYAELGLIDEPESEAKTMVAAFRARMDLGFLVPSSSRGDMADYKLSPMEQLHLALCSRRYTADELRTYREDDAAAKEQEKSYGEPEMQVVVENILFGGGKFIGFDATAEIALPSYSPALPKMSGKLSINTINGWAAGFKGKGKMMEMLEMEFELKVKGAPDSGAPVPDKLYFYIAGFTPGINVDGFGVLWIKGGGGGIDKLYDTIFGTSALPPLTILLSVKVAILQVIQARADLSLSLRGVGVKLSEGKVGEVEVLNTAQLRFDWYPEFYFLASVNVTILDIINGGGYIVVEDDGFFEFYLRVDISLPEAVPLVGGVKVAGADVGANSDKLWGNIYVLGVGLGVTYYWGGSVSFGGIGEGSKPTYPELLALQSVPVYNDPVTGRVLYAAVGTNARLLTVEGPTLFANETTHSITLVDAVERDEYTLTLADHNGSDVMVTIDYPAADAAAAEEVARDEVRINDYTLTWLDKTLAVDDPANVDANAHCRWIEATETTPARASVTVSFSQEQHFEKSWTLHTPKGAEVGLYGVDPLPELTELTATVDNGQVAATWKGTGLERFESVSFYAVAPNEEAEKTQEDLLVYKVEKTEEAPAAVTNGTATFDLPLTVPSGTYKLKAVASKSGEYNSVKVTETAFDFTNAALPAAPQAVTAENAGDHFIRAQVTPPAGDFDGYYVNVYEVGQDGALTLADGSGMFYDAAQVAQDGGALLTGGQYESAEVDENGQPKLGEDNQPVVKLRGLTAGKTYRVGVSTYKEQVEPGEPEKELCLFSSETLSAAPLILNQPQTPQITVTAVQTPVKVSHVGADGRTYETPTYRVPTAEDKTLSLTLAADQPVTGTWYLDRGAGGFDDTTGEPLEAADSKTVTQAAETIPIPLSNLAQGEHTLSFQGKNAQGDGCLFEYRFAVDATPPKLVISAPLNGGFFAGTGQVTVTGLTDPEATLSVAVNGTEQEIGTPTIAPDGTFSLNVGLDPGRAVQRLTLTATDPARNEERVELTLVSEAVSKIDRLAIYNGENEVTNKQLGGRTTTEAQLTLKGVLSDNSELDLTGHPLVEWEAVPAAGAVQVDENGAVTIGPGARGIVSAKLPVADAGARTATTIFGDTNTNGSQHGAADPTELEGLLTQARALTEAAYTPESWIVLAAAMDKAKAVLDRYVFTQDELDAAAQALQAAIQGLRPVGGSSTGGGVSSGGQGALITAQQPPATPREPAPPVSGVILPAVTVGRNGLVQVAVTDKQVEKALEQARAEAKSAGLEANGIALAVDLTGLKAEFETLRLTLSQDTWAKLTESGIVRLELRAGQASLWLDGQALRSVLEAADGDVVLTTKRVDPAKLPAAAQAAFGDRPVYDITLTAGGKAVTSFGAGRLTLLLPCPLSRGERGARLQMAWVDDGGGLGYLTESYYDGRQQVMEGRIGHLTIFGVAPRPVPDFTDIQGHWAGADILAAASYGLLNGTGGGYFTPDGAMTRSMLVAALYRMAGSPQTIGEGPTFPDVPADAYYAAAVAWAASRGVVKGTGAGAFEPDRPVTRQEMAVIMAGCAEAMAEPLPENRPALVFTDGAEIAGWAAEAVAATQRAGLLNGKDGGRFDPTGTATRAETAAVLRRFVELTDAK